MHVGPHVMYRYSFQVVTKLSLSPQILGKNTHVSSFMKIRPLGAEFQANRRTD
jgi:hypothetical protein